MKATFSGLRPLFNPQATGSAGSTAKVSREHAVIPEYGNMITVTGGKWTAYRKMAEHAMLVATLRHLIEPRLCVTKTLPIHNDEKWDPAELEIAAEQSDAADRRVVEYAIYCRDYEAARTAEDVLYRRLRLGQMNEARTKALLPIVAAAMAGKPYEIPAEVRALEEAKAKVAAAAAAQEADEPATEAAPEAAREDEAASEEKKA